MIKFKEVCLYYDREPVVQGINLTFREKAVTGILGPNGCGKSTMLSAIRGLVRYSGSILLAGKEVLKYPKAQLARFLAAVPQSHQPSFPYTCLEVVLSGRNPYISYLPKKPDVEKALECLAAVNAKQLAERPYTRISGGERQLILIARALCQEPQVILFDEPTASLDFSNTYRVMSLIKGISHAKGVTCAVTVHDPNLALLFCDEVAIFIKGALVQGSPEALITEQTLREVYGMDAVVYRQDGVRFVVPSF